MNATLNPLAPDFIYDAMRKVGTARAIDKAGKKWVIEFHDRHEDDRMSIVVIGAEESQRLTVGEEDFLFTDNTVRIQGVPQLVAFMHPVYIKKLRGFTRGNIPTPDVAGPTLP